MQKSIPQNYCHANFKHIFKHDIIDRLRTPAMPLDPWLEGGRQKKQQPSAAVYLGQESSNTEWQQEQEEGATCIEEKKSGRNREKEK